MVLFFFSLIVKADKIRDIIDMQKGEFCMVIKSSLPNGNMWKVGCIKQNVVWLSMIKGN